RPLMTMPTLTTARGWMALALLAVLAACAPPPPALPEPGLPPRYPEFVFPVAPADLGTPAAQERHHAAWLWLQAGDLRAAERQFSAALKAAPGFYPAQTGLGYVKLAAKDNRDAADRFERAVQANPRYVPALVGLGEALLALGENAEALANFE